VTATESGAANAGLPGGRNVAFTAFTKPTYTRLYWGPSSSALPRAALDGTLDSLTTISSSGTQAIWEGLTSWTNPDTGTVYSGTVPIRMRINLSGGVTSWTLASSVTGMPVSVGRVAANVTAGPSAPVNFTANVIFEADLPTDAIGVWTPINNVRVGGGLSVSTFTGAFYCAP